MTNRSKHPRSEDVLNVIRNFERVLPYAEGERLLNMLETGVSRLPLPVCNTPHCHAGWYLLAKKPFMQRIFSRHNNFTYGYLEMERDLNIPSISDWARENPEIWGNNSGSYVFSSPLAFVGPTRPNGAKTLKDIVDHWKEVYERLVKLENPVQKEERKDITPQLAVMPVDEIPDIIESKKKEYEIA